jgi:uncharacterized LabA/DUF88 family protein
VVKRANIYVDGFNLYYGALKGTPYKWLDLEALSRRLVPGYDINRIRYFTAKIIQDPADPGSWRRQYFYLRAVAANPIVSTHLGRYQRNRVRMTLVSPRPGGPRTVEVFKTEEKGTDVNLASYLLLDTFHNDCDLAVIVTNDADLAEPMRMAMREFRLEVGIVNPCPRVSAELRGLPVTFHRQIRAGVLAASQLPPILRDKTGLVRRPAAW